MASYIYGTSRANGLKEHVKVPVKHYPGKKIEFIVDKALNDLKNYDGNKFLYLMAGIPDVTHKFEDKNAANQIIYQEVVFNYQPNMLFNFKQLMDGTKQLLSDIHCIPIFATIPTMNLLNWNTIRYAQGKTRYLKYENDYGLMQDNLNYLLLDINKSIITFNNLNGKKNPHLHQLSELCRHGRRIYYYNRYVDGVHPDGNLLAKWGNCLNKTIIENYTETPCVSGKRTVFFI